MSSPLTTPLSVPTPPSVATELQRQRERISELEEQISNLGQLDEALTRNAELFEALIHASRDGIAMTRMDGTIIRIVKPIMGYSGADLVGTSVFDGVSDADRASMRECYAKLGSQRKVSYEVHFMRADGTMALYEGTLTDMLDNPSVMAVVLNYRNVTALRQAQISSLELHAVLNMAPYALFSKDLAGYILSWNRGAEAMFGYTAEEILGAHISTLVPAELREAEESVRKTIVETLAPLPPYQTFRLHRNGKRIPVELVLVPLLDSGRLRGIAHMSHVREAAE